MSNANDHSLVFGICICILLPSSKDLVADQFAIMPLVILNPVFKMIKKNKGYIEDNIFDQLENQVSDSVILFYHKKE